MVGMRASGGLRRLAVGLAVFGVVAVGGGMLPPVVDPVPTASAAVLAQGRAVTVSEQRVGGARVVSEQPLLVEQPLKEVVSHDPPRQRRPVEREQLRHRVVPQR